MPGRRSGAGLAALVLVFLGAAGFAAPGAEAAPGRCQPGTGVTVVVDYGPLGRSTAIGCDPGGAGDPASRVVPAAGFPITYAAGQPFVCRIDGLPDVEAEPCNRTPPADAYWGLFSNDGKGGGWVYSSQGVATLEVPAGGSIGWRFQDGSGRDVPGAAPTPPAPASSPSPDPTHEGGGSKPSVSPKPTPTPSRTPSQSSDSPSPTASASATPSEKPEKEKRRRARSPYRRGREEGGREERGVGLSGADADRRGDRERRRDARVGRSHLLDLRRIRLG